MVDSARNWRWPRQPGNARRSWGCWRRWPAGSRRTRRRFAQLALLGTGAIDVEVELEVFDGLQRPEDVAVPAEPLAGLRPIPTRHVCGLRCGWGSGRIGIWTVTDVPVTVYEPRVAVG